MQAHFLFRDSINNAIRNIINAIIISDIMKIFYLTNQIEINYTNEESHDKNFFA